MNSKRRSCVSSLGPSENESIVDTAALSCETPYIFCDARENRGKFAEIAAARETSYDYSLLVAVHPVVRRAGWLREQVTV